MTPVSDFERAVLEKLLSGDDPRLGALRQQLVALRVLERKFTGVGFFLKLALEPGDAPAMPAQDYAIDGVHGELEGLEHGAGFVLFVKRGYLDTLEGFSYDEPWPARINAYQLAYDQVPRVLSLPGLDAS